MKRLLLGMFFSVKRIAIACLEGSYFEPWDLSFCMCFKEVHTEKNSLLYMQLKYTCFVYSTSVHGR